MDFSYDNYRQFLLAMKEKAAVIAIKDWNKSDKSFLLRHDVDLAVEPAYIMAQIEQECGVNSTYYVLTSTHTYNPRSKINRKLLYKMAEKEFEIALHFDPTLYGDLKLADMTKKVHLECAIIEDITGKKVESISLHNPSVHGQYPEFEGFINAYSKEYFNTDFYLSDSSMNFRGKKPIEFINKIKESYIQVVIHSYHFGKEKMDYKKIMSRFYKEIYEAIDSDFRLYNAKYKEDVPTKFENIFK